MKKIVLYLLVCALLFSVCGCRIKPTLTPPVVLSETNAYTRHFTTVAIPSDAMNVEAETLELAMENTVKFVYNRRSDSALSTLVFYETDPASQEGRTIREFSYEYSSGYPDTFLFADGVVNQNTLWYVEYLEGDMIYGGTTPDRFTLCAVDNGTGQMRCRWELADAGMFTLLADGDDTAYLLYEYYDVFDNVHQYILLYANAATGALSEPYAMEYFTAPTSPLLLLNDGRMAVINQEVGTVIPFAKGTVTPETPFSLRGDGKADHFFDGTGDHPFMFLTDTVLYSADGTQLIDFAAWGATFDADTLRDVSLQDGVYRVLLEEPDCFGVYTLTPCTVEEAAPTLRIAGYWVKEDIHAAVTVFNRTRFDYTAQVIDYRQFDDDPDSPYLGGAGVTKLNTELLAGGDFDVLYLNDYLSSAALIKQGALLDLYPLLDRGGAITRDTFLPAVLEKTETDGHLYSLSTAFGIRTLVGDGRVIGERTSLSLADWYALQAAHPDAEVSDLVQDTFFYYLADVALHDFVTDNTARFDTDIFAAYLETLETLDTLDERMEELMDPSSVATYATLAEGRFLLMPMFFNTVSRYQTVLSNLEGNAEFTGYPTENGAGHRLEFANTLGIFAASDQQDAAWAFLQLVFRENTEPPRSVGEDPAMPTDRATFEKQVAYNRDPANFVDENGAVKTTYEGFPLRALSDEDVERLYTLISDAKPIAEIDYAIYEIMESEIAVFLHGEATAEETAARVQSRVQIYLNEQG